MAQPFAEVFARRGPAETRKAHEELSRTLDEACRNLAGTLAACPPALRQDLLAVITPRVRTLLQELDAPARQPANSPEGAGTGGAPPDGSGPGNGTLPGVTDGFPFAKLSPELLEWARQLSTEEELIAGLREVRETGGLEFRDLLPELDQANHPDE
jgi:hypothetical protein